MSSLHWICLQKDNSTCKFMFYDISDATTLEDLLAGASARIHEELHFDPSVNVKLKVYKPRQPIEQDALENKPIRKLEELFQTIDSEYLVTETIPCYTSETIHTDIPIMKALPPTPRSRGTIHEQEELERKSNREKIAKVAQSRASPSVGAKLNVLEVTQNTTRPDAVYNWRPMSLQPPPISIYHPIFAKFTRLMSMPLENEEFSHDELQSAFDFITSSLEFYTNEETRQGCLKGIQSIDTNILDQAHVLLMSGNFTLDGFSRSRTPVFPTGDRLAYKAFQYLKAEVGNCSCDPMAQAECAFLAVYSSDEYKPLRAVSCCPAFLIGIPGPYISVSGAVFADNFISEHLTDYLFIGPKSSTANESILDEAIGRMAQLFRTLKLCFADLDEYYLSLKPATAPTSAPSFVHPHFTEYTDGRVTYKLTYTQRLVTEYKEKAIFKATVQFTEPTSKPRTVVVKFTPKYGREGHEILANAKPHPYAPELLFCEEVESVGMYVVIMDFIEGQRLRVPIQRDVVGSLRKAIEMLHRAGYVFGDLREINVLQTKKGIMLLDFDWCGKVGVARYPRSIYMGGIPWHEDVRRGGKIEKAHDLHMISLLEGPP